ncbi:MAG TPA: hypothetical protein VLF63_00115 [Patescibacteria group bacterium]|nr:hypothetical protein [Patescibacteria group bacterium]
MSEIEVRAARDPDFARRSFRHGEFGQGLVNIALWKDGIYQHSDIGEVYVEFLEKTDRTVIFPHETLLVAKQRINEAEFIIDAAKVASEILNSQRATESAKLSNNN